MRYILILIFLFNIGQAYAIDKIIEIRGITFYKHFGVVDGYKEYNEKVLRDFFNQQQSKELFKEWRFIGNSVSIKRITNENYIVLLDLLKSKVKELRKYHNMTFPLNEQFYSPDYKREYY